MKSSIRSLLLLMSVSLPMASAIASADGIPCPPQLARLQTQHLAHGSLCELYSRYNKAVGSFEGHEQGAAARISNIMAPRLINNDDWQAHAAEYNYIPLNFYKPAPTTWVGWERGLDLIDHLIYKDGFFQTLTTITTPLLQTIQRTTMTGDGLMKAGFKGGEFRHDQEIGSMVIRKYAVTPSQQHEMATGGGYKSLDGGPLLRWHPVKCLEDLDPVTQKAQRAQRNYITWPTVGSNEFFNDEKGQQRQCGFVEYARMFEFQQQLQTWVSDLNAGLKAYADGTLNDDPLSFMARVQRRFIMIHPFQDGNGRMSRFMLEYVSRTMGLPPPVLVTMDDDIYVTEDQWASEIGAGLWHAVEIIETCNAKPNAPGCNVLADPPGLKRLQIRDEP